MDIDAKKPGGMASRRARKCFITLAIMTRDRTPPDKSGSDPRRARLAVALRANLRRRKDAARAEAADTADTAAPSGTADEPSREPEQ